MSKKVILNFCVLLLTSCSSQKAQIPGCDEVVMSEDFRYRHEEGGFSIERPRGFVSPSCEVVEGDQSSALLVRDKTGQLLRAERFPISQPCEDQERYLENFFHYRILPMWHKVCPKARIKSEEIVTLCDGIGYFVILHAPQASTQIDTLKHERADAWRAYLIRVSDGEVIALSTQETIYQLLAVRLDDLCPPRDKLLSFLQANMENYRQH